MVAGWYDIFLPWQLRDFITAQRAGRNIRIVIGPWVHASSDGIAESLRQSIAFFQERFGIAQQGAASHPRVRLFLMGAEEWREYPSWPIPNSVERTFYLNADGVLASISPASENTSTFDYDPARPTPSLHGAMLEGKSGSGDMAELERRSDVLIFTTDPLAADLDVIGSISGQIFLRSNTEHTDLYLCLCDVAPRARSTNVCDGYTRLRPTADHASPRNVTVEFWPTAYRFRRGHRIRVIVASGAHPRYSRNPGSGEPLGDACTMVVAHQEILHGPEHPSAIMLAVSENT
jgi:putative CocE/NonD family hydrolase